MKRSLKKKIIVILSATVLLTLVLFLSQEVFRHSDTEVMRNSYGEGEIVTEYELSIEGEEEKTALQIQVEEQEYTHGEMQDIFREISSQLDTIILGENESFDRVEKDLKLVTSVDGYPVQIQWQLDSYTVLNMYGEIREENLVEEGTLVHIQGILRYKEQESIYSRYAVVYPPTLKGTEKILYEIEKEVRRTEEASREKASFNLPQELNGKELTWRKKSQTNWYYVLILGVAVCIYLVYREMEKVKREHKQRKEQLLRDYPGMISKFTMLLGTGATVRSSWEKIVENYEEQKEALGVHVVYEEMATTIREIQGGASEGEAYERFGKRCGVTAYVKFGTLLSQNLRKGSKGISEILRMEAIQSFENRKNRAKRLGEEAGTKLLIPMLGMLAVVFVIVMVPAFLSMQI